MLRLAVVALLVGVAVYGAYPTAGTDESESFARVTRLLQQNRHARARAEIDSLIRRDPSRTDVYYAAINACWAGGCSECAARVALRLIEREQGRKLNQRLSKHELASLYLLVAQWREGQSLRGAEAFYKAALALDPDNPLFLNALGYFYADNGIKLDQALKLTIRAVRFAPDDGAIVDSLGWAQYRLRRYAEALETLSRAVQLEPDEAELRYHLAAAHEKRGHRDAARVEATKALILDPGLAEAAILLKTLHN